MAFFPLDATCLCPCDNFLCNFQHRNFSGRRDFFLRFCAPIATSRDLGFFFLTALYFFCNAISQFSLLQQTKIMTRFFVVTVRANGSFQIFFHVFYFALPIPARSGCFVTMLAALGFSNPLNPRFFYNFSVRVLCVSTARVQPTTVLSKPSNFVVGIKIHFCGFFAKFTRSSSKFSGSSEILPRDLCQSYFVLFKVYT